MDISSIPLTSGGGHLEPTKVIVHALAEYVVKDGRSYHALEWIRKKGLSAHIFVTPSGTVIRCRNDDQVAWHAKAQGHNFKSLGIEFLVPGAHNYGSFVDTIKQEYLTPQQYNAGVEFCRKEWVEKLGILHFAQHSKIDPENKTDPGTGFPWSKFLGDIGLIYKEPTNA